MDRLFIETKHFSRSVGNHLTVDEFKDLQHEIAMNPKLGAVIPGTRGIRKMRFAGRRKRSGKRGGLRIVYLDIPEARRVFLLDIYGKETQDDLSESEKKVLKKLATELKKLSESRGGSDE